MRRALALAALIFAFTLSTAIAESFGVSLDGANEIPEGDANGVGFADLILDGTTLRYAVAVFNIDPPTAMHIHAGTSRHVSAPVIPMETAWTQQDGCPSPHAAPCADRFVSVGSVVISEELAAAIAAHPAEFYLNVHNDAYPGGAVRGQLRFARYLPIVGQTPGAADSDWFTRFAVLNVSPDRDSGWAIEFAPASVSGNTARFVVEQERLSSMSMNASAEFPVRDHVGFGAARILSDQPLEATAAIYNGRGGSRGDLGFAMGAKRLEDARTSGVFVDLAASSGVDLSEHTGHRSNIGFFNPQVVPVEATFQAHHADGRVFGHRTVFIPPGGMAQYSVFDLINDVSVPDRVQDAFWVSWSASAPIFTYATVVNNETGDSELRD